MIYGGSLWCQEFAAVKIGIISLPDALSSSHVHIMKAFIRGIWEDRLDKVSEPAHVSVLWQRGMRESGPPGLFVRVTRARAAFCRFARRPFTIRVAEM